MKPATNDMIPANWPYFHICQDYHAPGKPSVFHVGDEDEDDDDQVQPAFASIARATADKSYDRMTYSEKQANPAPPTPQLDDILDTLISQASVPNLAALFKKAKGQGLIKPAYVYHQDS